MKIWNDVTGVLEDFKLATASLCEQSVGFLYDGVV